MLSVLLFQGGARVHHSLKSCCLVLPWRSFIILLTALVKMGQNVLPLTGCPRHKGKSVLWILKLEGLKSCEEPAENATSHTRKKITKTVLWRPRLLFSLAWHQDHNNCGNLQFHRTSNSNVSKSSPSPSGSLLLQLKISGLSIINGTGRLWKEQRRGWTARGPWELKNNVSLSSLDSLVAFPTSTQAFSSEPPTITDKKL